MQSRTNQERINIDVWRASHFAPRIRLLQPFTRKAATPVAKTQFRGPIQNRECTVLATVLSFIFAFAFSATLVQAETGPYTRDFLRSEQRKFGVRIEQAVMEVKGAQDRLAGGLSGLAERNLLLAVLYLDDAAIKIDGHEQRVTALRPSPLSYTRDKQIPLLLATYNDLRSKARRIEDSAFELLARQPSGITNGWKALPLYLSKRAEFASRFKEESLSAEVLASDIQVLQDYPLPLVLSGLINSKNFRAWTKTGDATWRSPVGTEFLSDGSLKPARVAATPSSLKSSNDPTTTALKQLELKTSELDQTVNRLRSEQSNLLTGISSRMERPSQESQTNAATIVPAKRSEVAIRPTEASTTHSSSNANTAVQPNRIPDGDKSPALVAVPTNHQSIQPEALPFVASIENKSVTTNQQLRSHDEKMVPAETENNPVLKSTTSAHTAIISDSPRRNLAWILVALVVLLVLSAAVVIGVAYANRSQSEYEIILTCGSESEENLTFALSPSEQCVVLKSKPGLESRGAEGDQPCIVVRLFGGPQVRPGGAAAILLNNEPVSTPRSLNAGDVIDIGHGDSRYSFTFQGGNFVSLEEPSASFESATTTLN